MIASSIFYNTKTEIFVVITVFLIYFIYTKLSPTKLTFYSENLKGHDPLLIETLKENNFIETDKIDNNSDFLVTKPKNIVKEMKKDENSRIHNILRFKKIILSLSNEKRITKKYSIWNSMVKKIGRDRAKLIMPETYNLLDPKEYQMLLENVNRENNPKFILKSERDGPNGLYIANNDYSDLLRQINNVNKYYNNIFSSSFKKKCKLDKNRYTVAQRIVENPLTINDRIFKMRVYILIVKNMGKTYGYLYRNGHVFYAKEKWNAHNLNNYNSLASKEMMHHNRTPEQVETLYKDYPRTVQQLKTWLHNNEFNETKMLDHLVEMCKVLCYICHQNVGNLVASINNLSMELFTLDMTIDKNMKPWLLKLNRTKELPNPTQSEITMRKKCWKDALRVSNLLRNVDGQNGFTLIWE